MTDVLLSCQIPKLKQFLIETIRKQNICTVAFKSAPSWATYSDALRVIEKPNFYESNVFAELSQF